MIIKIIQDWLDKHELKKKQNRVKDLYLKSCQNSLTTPVEKEITPIRESYLDELKKDVIKTPEFFRDIDRAKIIENFERDRKQSKLDENYEQIMTNTHKQLTTLDNTNNIVIQYCKTNNDSFMNIFAIFNKLLQSDIPNDIKVSIQKSGDTIYKALKKFNTKESLQKETNDVSIKKVKSIKAKTKNKTKRSKVV